MVYVGRIEGLIKDGDFSYIQFSPIYEISCRSLYLLTDFCHIADIEKAFHVISGQDDWKSIHVEIIDELIAVGGETGCIAAGNDLQDNY
jgi:hypothetical protein